jgi:hypothetical protein
MATGPKTKFAKLLAKKAKNDAAKRAGSGPGQYKRLVKKGTRIKKKILKQF